MAFIKSLRDATLTVKDGAGTPNEVTVAVASGDLKIGETRNHVEILDRGTLHEIKKGDEAPMDVSFSARFHGYEVADSGANAIEALLQRGTAASFTGTRDSTSDVYTVDLVWVLLDKDDGTEETVTLEDFYVTKLEVSEGDVNTYNVTGKCWKVAPTIS